MSSPHLSILIPFYRESPCALIEALLADSISQVEIIAYDDGGQDITLMEECQNLAQRFNDQVYFVFEAQNKGRSQARNALINKARAPYVLFLDADMMPATKGFLTQWLAHIVDAKPDVSFGGFKIDLDKTTKETKVHASMARFSDTKSAAERALNPAKSIFTSNLLVRKTLLAQQEFDPDFTGWGWEDVEWGLRVAKFHKLHHVDIPAWHLGLDTVASLIRKYDQSASNFIRILKKHPNEIKSYPSYKYARILSQLPLLSPMQFILKKMAQLTIFPTSFRGFCLRLYRTSVYARAL
jgi:glycosyltransferase involved in cell wall biosynthesis